MIKKNLLSIYIYRGIAFFSLLILLYNPPIFGIQITNLLYFVSLVYFFLSSRRLYLPQRKIIFLGGFLVCYGATVTLLNGAADFNMMGISRLFTGIISSIFIVHFIKLSQTNFTEFTVIKWIAYTAVFEAIIVILAFLSPSFHDWLVILCGGTSQYADKLFVLSSFRGIGWTFAQYSDFAICQGISLLCIVAISLHTPQPSFIQKNIIFISFILLITSGILIGRTFQLTMALSYIYYLWYVNKFHSFSDILKNFLVISIIILIMMYIIFNLLDQYIPRETLEWAFEVFKNFNNSNEIRSASTDELYEMWFLPQSAKTLWLGDGRYIGLDSHPTYSGSDVGFVNSVYYWGILGSILYYICIYKTFYYCWNKTHNYITKGLSVTILLTILIYNTKGIGNAFPYSCLLLEGILVSQSNQLIRNKNQKKTLIIHQNNNLVNYTKL